VISPHKIDYEINLDLNLYFKRTDKKEDRKINIGKELNG